MHSLTQLVYVERVDDTGSKGGVMNGCDLWVALAVTIAKIVLALLDMAKARRNNGEPPQQS